jgi:hypothetical protein
LLRCVAAARSGDAENAQVPLLDGLAAALEANQQLAETARWLREQNARLQEDSARPLAREDELERLRADLAVL